MDRFRSTLAAALLFAAGPVHAATISLTDPNSVDRFITPDGSVVVELKPLQALSSADFNTSSFNNSYGGQFSGYTINQGGSTGDAITVDTYDAGSTGSAGNGLPVVGGNIRLVYQNGTAPTSTPHFTQFVDTNQPLGGASPPYLDPAPNDDNLPFYWTEAERPGVQSGSMLAFRDFSKRRTDELFGTPAAKDSIDWEADLFYGQWDGTTTLNVEGGVRWGWEAKSATKGTAAASFINPTPGSAVTSGVGTSSFAWGSGQPSQLSFSPETFNPKPNEPFSLGRLTYFNGAITSGTGADSVDLQLDLGFDNAPENDKTDTVGFSLVNTPNTDDPQASADFVSFTFGNRTTTFNVLEGLTASADLVGIFRGGSFQQSTVANQTGKSLADPLDFPAISTFGFDVVGFGNPSDFGFVTTSAIPLPATGLLLVAGLAALGATGRRRR